MREPRLSKAVLTDRLQNQQSGRGRGRLVSAKLVKEHSSYSLTKSIQLFELAIDGVQSSTSLWFVLGQLKRQSAKLRLTASCVGLVCLCHR